MSKLRQIALVAFDGFQILDITGPASVFAAANNAEGKERYRVSVVDFEDTVHLFQGKNDAAVDRYAATGQTGAATAQLVEKIMAARTYPEQGYRSCLGIIHLGQHYEPERVEAAAKRAIKYNTYSYKSMNAILAAGLDRQPDSGEAPRQLTLPEHGNIRGRGYYAT